MFLCLAHAGQAWIFWLDNVTLLLPLAPSSDLITGSLRVNPLKVGKVLYLGTFLPQKPHITVPSFPLVLVCDQPLL